MRNLTLGSRYLIPVKGRVSFLDLPESVATDLLLGDGRIFGLVFERVCENEFANITRSTVTNGPFDLVLDGSMHLECKTIGASATSFNVSPSAMKGMGRTFDGPAFLTRVGSLDGFILARLLVCDSVPFIEVFALRVSDYLSGKHFLHKGKISPCISVKTAMALTALHGLKTAA